MTKENQNKLSKENAEKELQRLFDYYELEEDEIPKELMEAVNLVKPVVVKGIQKGLIEFKDDEEKGFTIVQTLKTGTVLEYKELDGAAKIRMEKKDISQSMERVTELLGYLCGNGSAAIAKLRGPDIKRAEAIGAMLLLI